MGMVIKTLGLDSLSKFWLNFLRVYMFLFVGSRMLRQLDMGCTVDICNRLGSSRNILVFWLRDRNTV